MQGARTLATARNVIEGIEATQMIRKGQILGITICCRAMAPITTLRLRKTGRQLTKRAARKGEAEKVHRENSCSAILA
jgi:hypothetical protein